MEETGERNCSQIASVLCYLGVNRELFKGIFIKRASQSDWSFENIILPDCEKLKGQDVRQILGNNFQNPGKRSKVNVMKIEEIKQIETLRR